MIQLLNIDCLDGLTQIPNDTADQALIDPPYFNYVTGHRKDKEDKLSKPLVQQSREDQLRTVQECIRVLKDGRAFFFFTNWQEAWWFQQRFSTFLHNEIIWFKGNWAAGDLEGSFGDSYEVIFLGVKGKGWKYKGKRLHSIWGLEDDEYDLRRVGTSRIHSTQKPVDLYKKIIEISTEPGALVIDPYAGSAASSIACLETGRNMLSYEVDLEYYKRGQERIATWIKEHTSNK